MSAVWTKSRESSVGVNVGQGGLGGHIAPATGVVVCRVRCAVAQAAVHGVDIEAVMLECIGDYHPVLPENNTIYTLHRCTTS